MVEFSFLGGLVVGPAVGLLATLAMDRVMPRLPEGATAPRVAASVLTGTHVDDAPDRLATWIHYVAGVGSGVLFLALVAATATLGATPVVTLGLAGVVMVGLMVGFFALVPLPRASGLPRQRIDQIRRDWGVCAVTYVVVAGVLVGVVDAGLPPL
ncbi:uncharacterized membrane protein YdcZ (DUF606 family) [Halorubrum alkaliphilum]|uniref:Uncharacterized membrane protein YdcZ (DUF606 family) n=1 Tax=Halorubrum alkaliphilum TaxID=261290 RepID=A0A8T4GAG3_9EURY|nr:hypothetical protein [Halorubrum alkaliphilum]MBP1921076.1 uncharacterized membrane protein YdcZ (DUF606 family) [Halorubrum alkaliphilum]